jgi:hypothetical protein
MYKEIGTQYWNVLGGGEVWPLQKQPLDWSPLLEVCDGVMAAAV